MRISDSDLKHLRRLLGYVRCEIGQTPDDLVATVQKILPAVGEVSEEGQARLVESYRQSKAVPQYVRAAVKALEKLLADQEGELVQGEVVRPALRQEDGR